MAATGKKTEKPAELKKVLLKYENKKTGAILETVCKVSGPDWKQIGGPKDKQKEPEKDPEGTEEDPEQTEEEE